MRRRNKGRRKIKKAVTEHNKYCDFQFSALGVPKNLVLRNGNFIGQ